MHTIVLTCDKHIRLIPGFMRQWDKYAGWWITTVCETEHVGIFHGGVAVGAGEWSERLGRYLNLINDDFVFMMLDDYYLTSPVDKHSFQLAVAKMEADTNIQKIDLSGDRMKFPHHAFTSGYVASTLEADYLASTQAALWRRSFLLDILNPVETIWQFEAHGTERIRERGGAVILGQVRPSFEYANVIERSDFTHWRSDGLSAEDVAELQELGMWGLG